MIDPKGQSCRAVRDRLQVAWDDGGIRAAVADSAHLADCAECRAWRALALRVDAALRDYPPAPLDLALTRRIAAAVEADRAASPPRRWPIRAAAGFAIAASLLIAVLTLTPGDEKPGVVRKPPTPAPEPVPEPEFAEADYASLEAGLAQVTSAVASSVRETAGETASRTRGLLALSADELPPLGTLTDAADESDSLQGLRSGASVAFSPVSKSTRKAFSMAFGSYLPAPSPPRE